MHRRPRVVSSALNLATAIVGAMLCVPFANAEPSPAVAATPMSAAVLAASQSPAAPSPDAAPRANSSHHNGPQIQHWTTPAGTRVYFVAAPELPILDIRMVFDAAGARDGDKSGLAALTNAVLGEGAGDLDATEIARRFEQVGAEISFDSQRDMAAISLRSLTDPALLNPALDTLGLILSKPTFPPESVERERRRTLVALKGQQEDLGIVAEKALYRAIYREHPYADAPIGTEEALQRLKRSDLVEHYQRYYVAKNAIIAMVGAISRSEAEKIAAQLSGNLPSGERAPALPPAPAPTAQTVRIKQPSQQTHVLAGHPGITRNDPDYFPLYVGNHILGGNGLVSRLSNEIREKRGLSYSTFSYFSPMRVAGPYILGLQTRNDQADMARDILIKELQRFVKEGPTAEELEAAQQNITGSQALRLDSNKKILDHIAMIGFYDLPLDYLDTFNAKIEAVTAEQIRDAFKRRVQPDALATVIAGGEVQASKVERGGKSEPAS